MSGDKQNKTTADIILSVGSACRTAKQLKVHKLRVCAFPLDWMKDYELDSVVTLFRAGFADFFKNKEIVGDKQSKNFHKLWVEDTDTGMHSLHHFLYGKDLELQYKEDFLPIMLKRYKFANKILQNAKHIVFVCNRNEDIAVLKQFLEEMHKLLACKLTLVNVNHDDKSPLYDEAKVNDYYDHQKIKLNDNLTIIQCYFDDRTPHKPESWVGNSEKWGVALAPFKLSLTTRLKSFLRRRNIRWVR